MDTMQRAMITLAAGRAGRKIEAAGLTDEDMKSVIESLDKIPEDTAGQLAAFKVSIGDEMFNTIASGPSLMPALGEWRENHGKRNMEKLTAALKERVPDLEQDEIEALLFETFSSGG